MLLDPEGRWKWAVVTDADRPRRLSTGPQVRRAMWSEHWAWKTGLMALGHRRVDLRRMDPEGEFVVMWLLYLDSRPVLEPVK